MKLILGLFVLLLVVALGIFALQKNPSVFQAPFKKTPTVKINNQSFSVFIPKNPVEKEVGLSNKKSLPQNEGMLFTFEKPDYYSFWMRNMKFPIDMIYINKNRVGTVYQDLQPPKSNESLTIFKPEEPADMVLEINSGLAKKYNIKKGDEVKIENL